VRSEFVDLPFGKLRSPFSTPLTRLRPTRYPKRQSSQSEAWRPGPLAGGDPISRQRVLKKPEGHGVALRPSCPSGFFRTSG
jgi:hypothetical protein